MTGDVLASAVRRCPAFIESLTPCAIAAWLPWRRNSRGLWFSAVSQSTLTSITTTVVTFVSACAFESD